MNELLPPERLNAWQLRALAKSLRQTHHDDPVTDSVAAALELVSRRRAAREPLMAIRQASPLLHRFLVRTVRAGLIAGINLANRWQAEESREPWSRSTTQGGDQARPSTRAASKQWSPGMSLSPLVVKQALLAVEHGSGLAPEICDALAARGWVEWVDHTHGTPIDVNHPRSLLRMTPEGRRQFDAETAAVF